MKKIIFILFLLIIAPALNAQNVILIGSVNWSEIVYNYEDFQTALANAESEKNIIIKEKLDAFEPQSVVYELEKQYEEKTLTLKKRFKDNINKAIKETAREKGFALVLNESAVIYSVGEITDLTAEILKKLNQKEE